MKKLKNEKGEWVVRDDVQISFKVGDKVLKGGLTVGYTGYAADGSRRHMGPELGFGFVLGDFYQEPVLLIKTAWGGKSLYRDFRPPSSASRPDTGNWPKPEDIGQSYRQMVERSPRRLGGARGQEYEIAGFYWQQGWNDMCTAPAIPEYAQNLVNLVKRSPQGIQCAEHAGGGRRAWQWRTGDRAAPCLNSERRRKKEQSRSRMLCSSRPPILPGRQNSRPVPRMDITGSPMRRVTF